MSPLVSVIVPNYNHEKFLKLRLESIFNQSFDDYEVILLDDASSDSSRKILKKYSLNSKVSEVKFNRENSGSPYLQWEKGIEIARGDYIWIAESDDYADPEFLETAIDVVRNSESDIFICNSYLVDKRNNKIHSTKKWNTALPDRPLAEFEGDVFNKQYMVKKNYLYNASSVLFAKELTKEIDNYWLSMRQSGDYLLWTEMLKRGDICYCSKELNYWRQHESVTSKNYQSYNFVIENVEVIERLISHYDVSLLKPGINGLWKKNKEIIKNRNRINKYDLIASFRIIKLYFRYTLFK